MKKLRLAIALVTSLACARGASAQGAQGPSYPASKEGDWIAKDFRLHTGEVMPELRIHYITVGAPSGEPVVILHGTAGSGASAEPSFCGRTARAKSTTRREQILHHPA
jgi:homoserine O-acetyltransferase